MITKNKRAASRFQFGLTLIEIMVALLLGIFLMTGIVQIFISNKQTYQIQQNLSRLQENGRFTLDYMRRYIRQSGYFDRGRRPASQNCGQILNSIINPPIRPVLVGAADGALAGATDNANGPNRITFRFESDGQSMTDCLGNPVNTNQISTNIFFINLSNGEPNLICQASSNPNPQPIIESVENMRILYGEQVAGSIRYVPIGNVGNINNVQSVRISLLLRTSENNLVNQPQPYQFDNNNDGALETITPTDRRLRRVFTTTIALRNSCSL